MRRTKNTIKYADAILLSDWHIREDKPICRIDNFWKAQETKIDFILNLANKNNCPILCGGDIGDKSRWSCRLLEFIIDKFKNVEIYVVPGQHDLPEHRLDSWKESGIGVLHAAGAIKVILAPETINGKFNVYPFPYGEEITNPEKEDNKLNIAISHQMVIQNKPLWPDQIAPKGHELLKKYSSYDLILTGDNHNAFISEYENRILVNPGSIMRTTAAQINFQPRVYKWFANENKTQICFLPIEIGAVTKKHIEEKKQMDDKMKKFIERIPSSITKGGQDEISFEQNMERYFNSNKTDKSIKNKIWEVIENDQ